MSCPISVSMISIIYLHILALPNFKNNNYTLILKITFQVSEHRGSAQQYRFYED